VLTVIEHAAAQTCNFSSKKKNEDGDKAQTLPQSLSLFCKPHGPVALFCKNKNNRDLLQKLDFEQHVKKN
jgi:hypothetical protein